MAIFGVRAPFSHVTASNANRAPHDSQTAGWTFNNPICAPHAHCTATIIVNARTVAGS